MLERFHAALQSGVVNSKSVKKLRLDTQVHTDYEMHPDEEREDWSQRAK